MRNVRIEEATIAELRAAGGLHEVIAPRSMVKTTSSMARE